MRRDWFTASRKGTSSRNDDPCRFAERRSPKARLSTCSGTRSCKGFRSSQPASQASDQDRLRQTLPSCYIYSQVHNYSFTDPSTDIGREDCGCPLCIKAASGLSQPIARFVQYLLEIQRPCAVYMPKTQSIVGMQCEAKELNPGFIEF